MRQFKMSNFSSVESPETAIHSIDINIPSQLHQEPVLAALIRDYNLIVNFQAAVLDRKATGGGWFSLSLAGAEQDLDRALEYLQNIGVEIFDRNSI
jgi:ABC-type methionine transport system ATPase subunit